MTILNHLSRFLTSFLETVTGGTRPMSARSPLHSHRFAGAPPLMLHDGCSIICGRRRLAQMGEGFLVAAKERPVAHVQRIWGWAVILMLALIVFSSPGWAQSVTLSTTSLTFGNQAVGTSSGA